MMRRRIMASIALAAMIAAAYGNDKSDVNTIDMVFIKGGTTGIANVGTVTLDDFSIGRYEVTQGLWEAVMGNNPSYFKGDDDLPVEFVSWNQVQEFIRKLNAKTGKIYRLPTSAEWEYAARGGNNSKGYQYSGGNDIDNAAWYLNNSGKKTRPVGTKQANELGIYDMSGNVCEWVNDAYENGPNRVTRGGSFDHGADKCAVSQIFSDSTNYTNFVVGFRLAISGTQTNAVAATEQAALLAVMERGRMSFESGKYDLAIKDYSTVISSPHATQNDKTNALLQRGNAYAKKGENGKAAADYNEAVKLVSMTLVSAVSVPQAQESIEDILERANVGIGEQKIKDYSTVISSPQATPSQKKIALFNRGINYNQMKEYDKAIADFTEALKINAKMGGSGNEVIYNWRGGAYDEIGEFDKAISDYTAALKMDMNNTIYFHNRGLAYLNNKDFDKATADFESLLKLEPNDENAKEMLKRIKDKKKEYVEEDEESEESGDGEYTGDMRKGGKGVSPRGSERSESALKFYNRGLNAYNARDYDKAIADFSEAIRLSPRRADFYAKRGDAYFDKGMYSRAVNDYEQAIRLDPKNADYYCNRGDVYMSMNDYKRAADDFEYALSLDPRHSQAQNLLRQAKSQGRGYSPRGHK